MNTLGTKSFYSFIEVKNSLSIILGPEKYSFDYVIHLLDTHLSRRFFCTMQHIARIQQNPSSVKQLMFILSMHRYILLLQTNLTIGKVAVKLMFHYFCLDTEIRL